MASSARDRDEAASPPPTLQEESSKGTKKPAKARQKKQVLDSWEDEDEQSSEDDVTTSPFRAPAASPTPSAKSPLFGSPHRWSPGSEPVTGAPAGDELRTRRPEKTDAVARRMIAAGLGLKAPKLTKEQKAYQRSVREQETRRKEQEKADEQRRRDEADRARAAVWDD